MRAFVRSAVGACAAATLSAESGHALESARYYDWPHMMWRGGDWPGMVLDPLVTLLFFALTIAVAVLLVRWLIGSPRYETPPAPRTTLDILKERYARGGFNKNEYEERRRTLSD